MKQPAQSIVIGLTTNVVFRFTESSNVLRYDVTYTVILPQIGTIPNI